MGAILQTSELRKAYGSVLALDGVSLDVSEGSIVGLLGPNGAGKTTLMKIVVGLVRADAGDVRLSPTAGRRLGALIERPGFYPYLTARANLVALGLTAGFARDALEPQVAAILERLGLGGAADRRFGEFSTGMRQRLGIAAALLGSPALLILDEPMSGLDPAGMATIRGLLRDLRDEGHAMLVSSHLLGEVEQVCDRIAIIDRGHVLAVGPIAELTSGPATWRLTFSAEEEAHRAVSVLAASFVATAQGAEVRAINRNGSASTPLELVMPAGLVPREATLQGTSLEEAYLRLIGAQGADHSR